MGVYQLLNAVPGWAEIRVSGAAPVLFLNCCAVRRIPLLAVREEDEYTLRVRVPAGKLRACRRAASATGCGAELLRTGGAPRLGKLLLRRAVPALCLLAVLLGLVWSKLFLWEIEVRGNERVSTARILDALRECGVDCGSFWPNFTSDQLRSELLLLLPELRWATVNIYGSRAEVIVRERIPRPALFDAKAPTDVTAAQTGFVTKVLALDGTALVRPGDAVLSGETLISARMDSISGGSRLVHAQGSVRGESYWELLSAAPAHVLRKTWTGAVHSRWALLIGKNRYNFYGNYSFCPESCDKIISVWECKIPGLFQLPITLIRESVREYTAGEAPADARRTAEALETGLHEALLRSIGPDGVIEAETVSFAEAEGRIWCCLRARCEQELGREEAHRE